jgi:parallel beta-helix repeat protein
MRYTPKTVGDGGILVIGAAAGSEFELNVVENVDVGIWLITTNGATVEHNKSTGSTFDGIAVVESSGNTINSNHVESNSQGGGLDPGAGIGLYTATGNFICDNKARNNLSDGFLADATSTGNKFDNNHAAKNGAWGFHDLSVGTGTSNTGNTYNGNKANGNTNGDSSPPGLAQ